MIREKQLVSHRLIPAPLLRRLIFFFFPKRTITVNSYNNQIISVIRVVHVGTSVFLYDTVIYIFEIAPLDIIPTLEHEGVA